MANFTKLDLAYMAGVIDGEGTFVISELSPRYEPSNRRARRKSPRHVVSIAVAMTDPIVPTALWEMFGGALGEYDYGKARGQLHHAPQTRWSVSGRKALACATALAPYLRLKRPQAELLIRYYDGFPTTNSSRGVPADELSRRRALRDEMQYHNRKGASRREVMQG